MSVCTAEHSYPVGLPGKNLKKVSYVVVNDVKVSTHSCMNRTVHHQHMCVLVTTVMDTQASKYKSLNCA
jgi:hypothetical protein